MTCTGIQSSVDYFPFGPSMPGRAYNGERYRFGFNGQENDKEVYGDGNFQNYGMRMYDTRVGRWMSVDPLADGRPNLTPYHYCQDNPLNRVDPNGMWDSDHIDTYGNVIAHYDDGDNSVYVHKYGTTKAQIDAQRAELKNTGGRGVWLGELGGNINVSEIMRNKLTVSSEVAKGLGIMGFYNAVKTGAPLDLKNNMNTIFGVAWDYDQKNRTKTTFSFGSYTNMTAADVGNYSFGYIGRYTYGGEGMSDKTLCSGAGLAEIKKNVFDEGWVLTGLKGLSQITIFCPVLLGPIPPLSSVVYYPRPPYGDRVIDYIWINVGIIDADKSKR